MEMGCIASALDWLHLVFGPGLQFTAQVSTPAPFDGYNERFRSHLFFLALNNPTNSHWNTDRTVVHLDFRQHRIYQSSTFAVSPNFVLRVTKYTYAEISCINRNQRGNGNLYMYKREAQRCQPYWSSSFQTSWRSLYLAVLELLIRFSFASGFDDVLEMKVSGELSSSSSSSLVLDLRRMAEPLFLGSPMTLSIAPDAGGLYKIGDAPHGIECMPLLPSRWS